MSIFDKADGVTSHEQFVEFAEAFLKDFIENRDEWENDNLESFLEALIAWVKDMEAFRRKAGTTLNDESPWQLVTDLLMAGRIYE